MTRGPLVKIYAAFSSAPASCGDAVQEAGREAVGHDGPWVFLEGNLLRLAWEGIWFPVDEVLAALATHLPCNAEGRLDLLDLEEWTLTRCRFEDGTFTKTTRNLNAVMDYSGL